MPHLIAFVLAIFIITNPLFAQRTGGSFGGSRWGSGSSSSSVSRPTSSFSWSSSVSRPSSSPVVVHTSSTPAIYIHTHWDDDDDEPSGDPTTDKYIVWFFSAFFITTALTILVSWYDSRRRGW